MTLSQQFSHALRARFESGLRGLHYIGLKLALEISRPIGPFAEELLQLAQKRTTIRHEGPLIDFINLRIARAIRP